jgi:hypothetical protein
MPKLEGGLWPARSFSSASRDLWQKLRASWNSCVLLLILPAISMAQQIAFGDYAMTSISGVSWDFAWESRQAGSYGNVPVFFIGRYALLANKQAAGRGKDLADVEALLPPLDAGKDI